MTTPPTLVFDLDGTLVDTAPDLLEALDHVLASGGLAAADRSAMRRHAGQGGRAMIEQAYAAQQRTIDAPLMAEMLKRFLDHYRTNIPGLSVPFPGAVEAVERFSAAGWRLAICTNKYDEFATLLMAGLGLADRFHAICGADTFGFRKPDPRHLIETIRLAGGDPGRALMVGDTRTDIDTARNAGIPVVGVEFGYTDRHVREFEPSAIISHFDQLTVLLAEQLVAAAQG